MRLRSAAAAGPLLALACALVLGGCGGNTRVSDVLPRTTPEIAPLQEPKEGETGSEGTTTTSVTGENKATPEEEVEGATEGEAPVTEAPEEVALEEATGGTETPEEEAPITSETEAEAGGTGAEEAPITGGVEETEEAPAEETISPTGGAGAP